MSKVLFPARKYDGSFSVEIALCFIGDTNLKSKIKSWITKDWMPSNLNWKREWRTGDNLETINEEVLSYEAEFSGAPEVVISDDAELRIRVSGKVSAKFWKDWLLLRFLPDLKATFPEVGDQLYIRNVEK